MNRVLKLMLGRYSLFSRLCFGGGKEEIMSDYCITGEREQGPSAYPNANGMNLMERRQVYREMVAQLRRNGPLSARRRKTLVQFAACLGLSAMQAGSVVEEVERSIGTAASTASSPDLRLSVDRPIRARLVRGSVPIALGAFLVLAWFLMRVS